MNQSDRLKDMTADELAGWQAGWKPRTSNDILAEKEWQRRFMAAQHAHDRDLLQPQIKWMKISVVTGFIGALIGAILTLAATSYYSGEPTDTDAAVERALAKRERDLVTGFLPDAEEIAKELLAVETPYSSPPTTIEELLAPFTTIIIENLGTTSSEQAAGAYGEPAGGSTDAQP